MKRKTVSTTPPPQRPAATTPPPSVAAAPPTESPPPAIGRAMTVEDPLTTQLLAEVTRRCETLDFDDSSIDAALDSIDDNVATTSHPHTRRRKKR